MIDPAPSPARSERLRIALIVYSLAALLVMPLSLFWALLSVMASTTTTNMGFVNAYIVANAAFCGWSASWEAGSRSSCGAIGSAGSCWPRPLSRWSSA